MHQCKSDLFTGTLKDQITAFLISVQHGKNRKWNSTLDLKRAVVSDDHSFFRREPQYQRIKFGTGGQEKVIAIFQMLQRDSHFSDT